jgi:uncharacterized protein (TIGR03067 family)
MSCDVAAGCGGALMKNSLALTGVVACVMLLGSDSPKEFDDAVEMDGLMGSWTPTDVTYNGGPAGIGMRLLTFKGERYVYRGRDFIETGTYSVDLSRKPGRIDLVPAEGGTTCKYLCQLDRDSIRVARTLRGTVRPTGFEERDVIVITLQRVTK